MPVSAAESRIAEQLDALARDHASGALRMAGDANGVIYLDSGYIVFAESSRVPSFSVRLLALPSLSGSRRALLPEEAPPDETFGDLMVERGLITRSDFQAVLRSAVVDAIIDLTVPGAGEPISVSSWFVPQERHWAASSLGLDPESLRAEIGQSAALAARRDIPVQTRPRLSDLQRPAAVVTADQWRVACNLDGGTTVRDVAWRCGMPLNDTLTRVSELVQAGLCTLDAPAEPVPPARDTGTVALEPPASQRLSLPRRRRGATLIPPKAAPSDSLRPSALSEPFAPPSQEKLREVLEGLRRLD